MKKQWLLIGKASVGFDLGRVHYMEKNSAEKILGKIVGKNSGEK